MVVLTTCLGIGVNVSLFYYLSYFYWPVIEAPQPERLVWLWRSTPEDPRAGFPLGDFRALGRSGGAFGRVSAYRIFGASLVSDEGNLHVWGHAVSGDYFPLFGARPALGRLLGPEDDVAGAERVLVLGHEHWTRHFGADPAVLGRRVLLDGRHPYTVVGVTSTGFQGEGLAAAVYIPLDTAGEVIEDLARPESGRLRVLARLADGVSLARARAALASTARGLDDTDPGAQPRAFHAELASDDTAWTEGDPVVESARLLTVASGLLLLLAAANVAHLMLARAIGRHREMAVRSALGAPRWRLARVQVIESLLLTGAGGALGAGLLGPARRLMEHYLASTNPIELGEWGAGSSIVADSGLVALYAVAVTLAVAVLVASAPVVRLWRQDVVPSLGSEARAIGGRSGGGALLVGLQVALSVVLLVGAGLLLRTLLEVRALPLGFETSGRLAVSLTAPAEPGAAGAATRGPRLYRELLAAARRLPGVRRAALALRVPPYARYGARVELPERGETHGISYNAVSPGYFDTLGIPVLAGRVFDRRDGPEAPGVVVATRAAALALWPGQSPLGRRLRTPTGEGEATARTYEVVGVVADSGHRKTRDAGPPHLYFALEQLYRPRVTLLVQADEPPEPALRASLRRRVPELAIVGISPLAEQVRRGSSEEQMNAELAGGLGTLGVLLSALGVFGVISYTTARRTREMGVRMALGSSRGGIARLVLWDALRIVGPGLAVGLAASWALAGLLRSQLYGVGTRDPLTFAAVATLLGVIGAASAAAPALRAASIEPSRALRDE